MKEITMPKLSDTMAEGAVVVWRKSVGAPVERGEVIAEVETDKATMELEAFASGVLLEIRVEAGVTVPVGTVIGLIGSAEERPQPIGVASALPRTEAIPAGEPAQGQAVEGKADSAPVPAAAHEGGEGLAAPVVRRRARDLGVDLAHVQGSGPGGRVLLEDLEGLAAGPKEKEPSALPAALVPEDSGQIPASTAQPLSRMRAAIARTVVESWQTIPQFSVSVEVRMDETERLRQRLKVQAPNLSLTAFLVRATALVLRDFPLLNASLRDEQLVVHPEINIGVVVRREDGLLVPVLRNCVQLSLAETAQRTSQLVERARRGQLAHTELNGGTFAISNLGMHGIHAFVALILPPMAAALAVGAVRDAVVAEEGRVVVARVMTLTLSADHRIVDGVYAADFLRELKRLLEHPEPLAEG